MLLTAISIITIVKLNGTKEVKLDNVKLKEQISNMNGLAIMTEQSDGTYKESSSNSWPADMYFNEELSGCVDNLGNKIENSLTYENGIANVETSDTSYCVLYFNKTTNLYQLCKNYENIDECSKNENLEYVKDIWNSTLEEDGYRYVGTNPDNYICFGTTNQEECKNNTDKYMYRIIGIFEDSDGKQHLKLIKKEALNAAYAWNIDYQTNVDWDESDLFKGINGSYFATNSEYSYMQDSAWDNLILTWEYTATNTKTYENSGINYHYSTVNQTYLHEMNRSTKTNAVGEWKTVGSKIGLMYVSDYQLSLGSKALNYTNSDNTHYALMKTGWMHISNNDSLHYLNKEWTMTRFGNNNNYYFVWDIYSEGLIGWDGINGEIYIRPTFYLESDIKLDKGKGSITEPFIIS